MPGFGRSIFGSGPFGRSDTGRDLIVELFPDSYFTNKDDSEDPLVQLLNTFANSVNARRSQIDSLRLLVDYDSAPVEFLRLLGNTLGLQIDKNDPEFLQRTFVSTASQWLQIKGSNKGYQYRGLASGFSVRVQNFWRVDESLESTIPARYKFFYRPKGHDKPVYLFGNLTTGSATITGIDTSTLGPWVVGKEVFGPGLPLTRPKIVSYTSNTLVLDQQAEQTSRNSIGIHRVNSLLYTDSPPGTHRGLALYLFGSAGQNWMTANRVNTTSSQGTFSVELRFIANGTTNDQILFQNNIAANDRLAVKITGNALKIAKSAISNFLVITAPIEAKKEYYVVYTVDNGTPKLFLNGIESGTQSVEAIDFGGDTTSLWIGASSDQTQFFDGRIWDVRISDRGLSSEDVSSRVFSTYEPDSALKNNWLLSGDAIDIVSGNDGTLNGGSSYDVVVQIGASSEAQDDVSYLVFPETEKYAKSAYLGLIFQVKKYFEGVRYNNLLDLVIEKVRDVTALHHEVTPPVYLVEIPVETNFSASMQIADRNSSEFYGGGEVAYIDVATANRFDQLPADRSDLYLDRSGLTVQIEKFAGFQAVVYQNVSVSISSGSYGVPVVENSIGVSMTVAVGSVASVSVGMFMDLEQADSGNTDGGLKASIE